MSEDEYLDEDFYEDEKNYGFEEPDPEELVDILNESKEDTEKSNKSDDDTLSQIHDILSSPTSDALLKSSEKKQRDNDSDSKLEESSDYKQEKLSDNYSDAKNDYTTSDSKGSKDDTIDNYANFFSNTSTPTSSKPSTPTRPRSGTSSSASASSQDLKDQVETLTSELNKYKKKCSSLEDKLDVAMALGGTNSAFLKREVKDIIKRICDKNKINHEIYGKKKITENDLISFLKVFEDNKTLNKYNSSASLSSTTNSSMSQNKVSDKLAMLEEQLKEASSTIDNSNQIKLKFISLNEKLRVEKDNKRNLEIELASTKKKVEMLSDHIEKLITHLKRESSNKLKLNENINVLEKTNKKNNEKINLIMKKSLAKDRLILELREGSKILEDQLRLMDEKYIELRGKLDYTRSISSKKLKKAEKVASDLRVKFAMSTNNSNILLDNIDLSSPTSSQYHNNDDFSWKSNNKFNSSTSSINTINSNKSSIIKRNEPSMEVVMEKIKQQQGIRTEWTEDKIKKLFVAGSTR